MKIKINKSILIPVILLVYLAVMSYIGYPGYLSGENSPAHYFGTILATLFIIILLHFFIKKREKMRKEREDDMKRRSEAHRQS